MQKIYMVDVITISSTILGGVIIKTIIFILLIGIVLFPGIAHAADLTINSVADMVDNCSYNSTTRMHNCTLDSVNEKWTNVYVNIPKFVGTDVIVAGYNSKKYGWQQARLDSRHIIIEAENDVVFATGIDMLGSQGDSGGRPGRLTVKAKKILVNGNIKSYGAYFDKYDAAGSGASAGADVVLESGNTTITGSILNYGGSCCCEENSCPSNVGGNTYIKGRDFTIEGTVYSYGGSGTGRYQSGRNAGNLDINITGHATINGNLKLYGSHATTKDDRNGGSGGSVTVVAKNFNFAGTSYQYGGSGGKYRSKKKNLFCGHSGTSGSFRVIAEDINITGNINTYGTGISGCCYGGTPGDISLRGRNSVYLNYANADANKRRVGANIDIYSKGSVTIGTLSLKGGPGTGYDGWCKNLKGGAPCRTPGNIGGTLRVYGDTIKVTGPITATGGKSGGETGWDSCMSLGGGDGGAIYLNALKNLSILNTITSDGGLSTGRSGDGGVGGKIHLASDVVEISAPVHATGGKGGYKSDYHGGSAGNGGKGGYVFIYTDDLSVSSVVEAKGGESGWSEEEVGDDCERGDGGDGGKIILFRNGTILDVDSSFDISGGPLPSGGCTPVSPPWDGPVGDPGEKKGYMREVDSGFRIISFVKNAVDMSNFTGSLQARIIDKHTRQYVYPPLSYAIWQPYAQIYSGDLNSYLGREIPARILLGRQHTMEIIISDDLLFELSNCNLYIAKCNPVFIDFVEYYESI